MSDVNGWRNVLPMFSLFIAIDLVQFLFLGDENIEKKKFRNFSNFKITLRQVISRQIVVYMSESIFFQILLSVINPEAKIVFGRKKWLRGDEANELWHKSGSLKNDEIWKRRNVDENMKTSNFHLSVKILQNCRNLYFYRFIKIQPFYCGDFFTSKKSGIQRKRWGTFSCNCFDHPQ